MTEATDKPVRILFTGFEPSGDDHASTVIAVLRRRYPDLEMYAWGGPKMEAAGATLIEETGRDAVMGMPGLAKIREHQKINERVAEWMDENSPTVHVPVDSPAANFPICAHAKERGTKVVHLVAPQVWAWASWRIRKLKRLTDHVCCVLPFEEDWFRERGVPAEFVGHPLFDKPLDLSAMDAQITDWPRVSPKIALMPGSRPAEMRKNFPILVNAFRLLAREHGELSGMVAATRADIEPVLRELAAGAGGWPDGLEMVHGKTDAVTRWCDIALAVSGTVTLQIARQHKPMVIVFKSNPVFYWLIAKWLVKTPVFTLPNLIAGKRIVPEMVPYFGGPGPLAEAAVGLLDKPEEASRVSAALEAMTNKFAGRSASEGAATVIARMAGLPPVEVEAEKPDPTLVA